MAEVNLFNELDKAIEEQIDQKIKTASSNVEESKKVTEMELASFLDQKETTKEASEAGVADEKFDDLDFNHLSEIFGSEGTDYEKIANSALEVLNSELKEFTKVASINVTDTVRESTLAKAAWALKSAAKELGEVHTSLKVAGRVKKLVSNNIFSDEEAAENYVKSASERLSGDDVAIDKHLDNLVIAKETDFSSDLSKVAAHSGNAVDDFIALVNRELD